MAMEMVMAMAMLMHGNGDGDGDGDGEWRWRSFASDGDGWKSIGECESPRCTVHAPTRRPPCSTALRPHSVACRTCRDSGSTVTKEGVKGQGTTEGMRLGCDSVGSGRSAMRIGGKGDHATWDWTVGGR